MQHDSKVFVVDDEPQMRRSLELLFRSAGYQAKSFASAEEFLNDNKSDCPACLILDVQMGGMSGLELQSQLTQRGTCLPIIMISGYAAVPTVVAAMSGGAIDFLEKPFSDEVLLEKVAEAIRRDAQGRHAPAKIRSRLESLTAREREVLDHLVSGENTKLIANRLEISAKTVEKHRVNVLAKMKAESVVELVHLMLSSNNSPLSPRNAA